MVDILIPLYNNEKYVNRCISSIKSQTFKNYDVYIINDGSTDLSEQVAKNLIGSDERFHLITRENRGVSATRQELIDISKSPYVLFIDSDDYFYENTSLEKMINKAVETNADILITPIVKNINDNIITNRSTDGTTKTVTTKQSLIDLFYIRYNGASLIGALFKRELFNEEKFKKGIIYEDTDIYYRLNLHAKNITYYNIPVYVYVIQQNSIMRGNFSSKNMILLDISKKIVEDMKSYDKDLVVPAIYSLNNNCLELLRLKVLSSSKYNDNKQIITEIRKNKDIVLKDENSRRGKIIQTKVACMGEFWFKLLMVIYVRILHKF